MTTKVSKFKWSFLGRDSHVLKSSKLESLRHNIVLSAFQSSNMRICSQIATCKNIPELIPVLECTIQKNPQTQQLWKPLVSRLVWGSSDTLNMVRAHLLSCWDQTVWLSTVKLPTSVFPITTPSADCALHLDELSRHLILTSLEENLSGTAKVLCNRLRYHYKILFGKISTHRIQQKSIFPPLNVNIFPFQPSPASYT